MRRTGAGGNYDRPKKGPGFSDNTVNDSENGPKGLLKNTMIYNAGANVRYAAFYGHGSRHYEQCGLVGELIRETKKEGLSPARSRNLSLIIA